MLKDNSNISASKKNSDETAGPAIADEDVRERLLAAAGPVFAKRGFDGATVREICRAAGVNVAGIAYYYGDKMGLYLEVIRSIRAKCEARFPMPQATDEPIEKRLRSHIWVMLSRMLNDQDEGGWEAQLMMREMHRPTEAFQELIEQYFRPNFVQLCHILERMMPPSTPLPECQRLAFSVVGQCLYYRVGRETVRAMIPTQVRNDYFSIESLVEHIASLTEAAASRPLSKITAPASNLNP